LAEITIGHPAQRISNPPGLFHELTDYLSIEAEASRDRGWTVWFIRSALHTLRSCAIALVRLIRV
jgi:hypothetical protein